MWTCQTSSILRRRWQIATKRRKKEMRGKLLRIRRTRRSPPCRRESRQRLICFIRRMMSPGLERLDSWAIWKISTRVLTLIFRRTTMRWRVTWLWKSWIAKEARLETRDQGWNRDSHQSQSRAWHKKMRTMEKCHWWREATISYSRIIRYSMKTIMMLKVAQSE